MDKNGNRREYTSVDYGKMKVLSFNSFEEEAEYTSKQRAETSYEGRFTDMEQLSKRVFHTTCLPDNRWKPIERILK